MGPDDRLFHDESLSEGHAGESAELCVAALDELLEIRAGLNCVTWQASARRFVSYCSLTSTTKDGAAESLMK